jgi:hypothetical protein
MTIRGRGLSPEYVEGRPTYHGEGEAGLPSSSFLLGLPLLWKEEDIRVRRGEMQGSVCGRRAYSIPRQSAQ